MVTNQYLFLKNEEGQVIDKFKWNGKELAELKFRIIDSSGKLSQQLYSISSTIL